jgi:DNA-binding ferritin-like protein
MKLTRSKLLLVGVVVVLAASVSFALTSCETTTRLDRFEKMLDTDSKLTFEFHRVPDDPEGLGLRFPGFVLGFEKGPRDRIGCPELANDKLDDRVDLAKAGGAAPATVRSKLRSVLDDGKCIFLSHLVEYHDDKRWAAITHQFHFNLYGDLHRASRQSADMDKELLKAYDRSWQALDQFGALLKARIAETHATHIILYTFGWNSGQTEALRNVNSLHLRLLEVASPTVRAIPVLVTWPSHWWDNAFGALSYMNKADDADELGSTLLNWLVHRTLLEVTVPLGVRTVAVGHSFGARALGRALCSESLLTKPGSGAPWDLFVGLQGAFSINRFLAWEDADEGTPCNAFSKQIGKVVLTWSSHDSANMVASWSRHAGGKRGYETALDYMNSDEGKSRPVIEKVTADRDGHINPSDAGSERIVYVDASSIVRYDNYVKGGRAHSDIYNEQIARMLAQVIERYAPMAEARGP